MGKQNKPDPISLPEKLSCLYIQWFASKYTICKEGLWKNNVLHCRSLSSSMETATDQFPEVNLPWTPGVRTRQPPMSFCTVLTCWSRNQQ